MKIWYSVTVIKLPRPIAANLRLLKMDQCIIQCMGDLRIFKLWIYSKLISNVFSFQRLFAADSFKIQETAWEVLTIERLFLLKIDEVVSVKGWWKREHQFGSEISLHPQHFHNFFTHVAKNRINACYISHWSKARRRIKLKTVEINKILNLALAGIEKSIYKVWG